MKRNTIFIAGLSAILCGAVQAAGVSDSAMGLSKTSVYDAPTPEAASYEGGNPGSNKPYDKSYHTAPPMIPHKVDNFVPITRQSNLCVGCHDKPALIGADMPGLPTPAPKSHYVDPRSGKENMASINASRFVCTQCHAAQADAVPLVGNTFTADK